MRWDELRVDDEERLTLPGYRDPAVVRTFDAPEALDTRFYEVRAKSVLNRVPKRSRMPFEWTVNPYRGCSHACNYCQAAETPILMANGRPKALAELRPGDRIYGTVCRDSYRRYAITEVLDNWSTIKPAYRVTLEDGTGLIASGDHRFLTGRGWKHVTGTEQGRGRRPHLTLNDKLMGTGRFADPPDDSADYRLGYLCGMIRGDGHVGSYSYARPGRKHGDVHRFRLALTDFEPLQRTRRYLADLGVSTTELAFHAATATQRPLRAIRSQSRVHVATVRELVRWPRAPSPNWLKGFLAGIFDAEGGYSCGILRICNTDHEIIAWTTFALRRLGFIYALEDRGPPNGLVSVRLLLGVPQHLRFFLTVDPATSRKRTIEGTAIKSAARLGVQAIEPLGEERLYDITTGTGDFIANGVVSHNCFARPTHTYLDFDAGRDFEREIVVKVNAPEVLRAELRRPSWRRQHVAMGTNTDPYQWVEGRYQLMPGIWKALAENGTPGSILTKSPLLLRDLELMRAVPGIRANLSVPTLDEKAWRATEPRTPNPRARLEAVAELNRAGIPCGILIAPLMPGINDSPEQVARIIELAAEAGAVDIGGIALHLRGEVKEIFFNWLREHRPELLPRYERLYARGAYAPKEERERLARLARPADLPRRPLRAGAGTAVAERDPAGGSGGSEAAPPVEQPTLF